MAFGSPSFWWHKKALVIFLILISNLLSTFISVVSDVIPSKGSGSNDVDLAINICREKLALDPHNSPRIQLSLAKLLESRLYPSNESQTADDILLAKEVMDLYAAVGHSSQKVPDKIRFESLHRAGRISNEYYSNLVSNDDSNVSHDNRPDTTTIRHYIDALSLLIAWGEASSVVETEVVQSLLDEIMPLLLRTASATADDHVATALQLCEGLSPLYPEDPSIDEWMAASLRKSNRHMDAFQFYKSATLKSKQRLLQELRLESSSKNNSDHELSNRFHLFLSKFIDMSVLTASSAREIGLTRDDQFQFLFDAQNHLQQITKNNGKPSRDIETNDFHDQELRINKPYTNHDASSYDSILRNSILDLYNQMGIVEKKYGNAIEAGNYFLQALEFDPSDGHALVQLASISNDDPKMKQKIFKVQSLNPKYVSDLFDAYSIKFESELVGKLDYKGHEQVYNAIVSIPQNVLPQKCKEKTVVIDLGCGTGLLGILLRGYKKGGYGKRDELIGVDLSHRMVEIARMKKVQIRTPHNNVMSLPVYTNVVHADMVKYLSSAHLDDSVDLITASDAFIYVGNLENVFDQCRRCLIEGGILAFSVELLFSDHENIEVLAEESFIEGMRLLKSGRFGHTRQYVENLATNYGFHVLSWNNCTLRKQGGKDVSGAIAVLSKKTHRD